MIPEGIVINPLQGSLNSEVDITVDAYSGRLQHTPREVYCWSSDDTVKDMIEVEQLGKQEYISITSDIVFELDEFGGTAIITGNSNSALIGISRLDDTPQISFELYINGTLIPEWDYLNPRLIPGDPGASEEYSWEIHAKVEENRTLEKRSWKFYINNDGSIQTAVITINQAEGYKSYAIPEIDSLIYEILPIPASGGTATVKEITYHQNWGWNGNTENGGVLYDGGVLEYSGTYVNAITGDAVIPSKGENISNLTTATQAFVRVTMNGLTSELFGASITQAPNYITDMTVSGGSLSYADIPSSGGTSDAVLILPLLEVHYTSGAIGTAIPESEFGTLETVISYSLDTIQNGFASADSSTGTITASNRGTDAGDDWLSGLVTCHIEYKWNHSDTYIDGGIIQAEHDITSRCKQLKNVPVSIEITAHEFSYPDITPSANFATPQHDSLIDITFSSGGVLSNVQIGDYEGYLVRKTATYTLQTIQNGFIAVDVNTGVLSATNMGNILGSRVSGTVTENLVYELVIDSEIGGGTLSDDSTATAVCTQGVNEVVYSDLQVELQVPDIPAYGGSVNAGAVNYQQTATYTSGTVETVAIGGKIVFGDPVTGEDLGTVLTPRTAKGSLSTTVTANGETVTVTETVYQEANVVEQLTVDPDFSYDSSLIPAGGGSKSPVLDGAVVLLFSSNHTVTHNASSTELQYSITAQRHFTMVESTGFSIDADTGVVTAEHSAHRAPQRTSGDITSTLTWQYVPQTGLGNPLNESASKTVSGVTQEANTVTQIQLRIEKYQPDDTWDPVSAWDNLPADDGYIGIYGYRIYTFKDGHTEEEEVGRLSVSQGLVVSVSWAAAHTNGGLHIEGRTTVIGNARTGTVYWQESGAVNSNTLSFTQRGNYVTGITVTCNVSYSKSVSAAEGTVNPTISSSRVFRFTSGSTTSTTPSTSYGSLSGSNRFSGSAAYGFSAPNSTTGAMTVSNRGTTVGSARNSGTVTYTRSETWNHNSTYSAGGSVSDSATDTDYATQVANAIVSTTYSNVTVTITSVADIPASGGSRNSGSCIYSQTRTYTYTSGNSHSSSLTSGGQVSWTTVSASSKGTTVSGSTRVGTITCTVTLNGKSGSDTAYVYQAANSVIKETYPETTHNIGSYSFSGHGLFASNHSEGLPFSRLAYNFTCNEVYSSGSTAQRTIICNAATAYRSMDCPTWLIVDDSAKKVRPNYNTNNSGYKSGVVLAKFSSGSQNLYITCNVSIYSVINVTFVIGNSTLIDSNFRLRVYCDYPGYCIPYDVSGIDLPRRTAGKQFTVTVPVVAAEFTSNGSHPSGTTWAITIDIADSRLADMRVTGKRFSGNETLYYDAKRL